MIIVKLPDGATAQFPDGTPPDTMKAAIQRRMAANPDMYASGNVKRLSGRATPQDQEQPNMMGGLTTFLEHGIGDLPIVGGVLQGTGDALSTTIQGALTGQDPAKLREELAKRRQVRNNTYPLSAMSGGLTGNVAAFGGLGATEAGAQALGLTGKFGSRLLNSALSSGAINAADASIRGGNPLEAGALGAGIGGAIPLVGGAVGQAIKMAGRKAAPLIGAIKDATGEAGRRVGTAYNRDLAANPGLMANATDEATAAANGLDLRNVDRGGETTRALARSVANQSPEARATIENTASDRFAGQGQRASDFVKKMAGGNTDDLATLDFLQQAARATNKGAYQAAESAPAARAIWTPEIRKLMQSDLFRSAINEAETVGTDFAAISGHKAVRNPFVFGKDGSIGLRKMPDGSTALPNLQFWDIVQRNLRRVRETALGQNDKTTASLAGQLRGILNTELDAAVPAFGKARKGAAAFFGAEDALEAGKNFAGNLKLVPEARQAFNSLSKPEQQLFRIGHASSLIDRIMATGDRANVINQVFKNPAMREMIELIYGPAKARELEAYIRVEDIVDRLRGAMGNSTTARQLMELGIGAGSGFALTGGDWKGAIGGAALTRGGRFLGQKLDDRVMQEVAKLLLSGDKAALQKAITNASMSENWMKALDAFGRQLGVVSRGSAMAMAS